MASGTPTKIPNIFRTVPAYSVNAQNFQPENVTWHAYNIDKPILVTSWAQFKALNDQITAVKPMARSADTTETADQLAKMNDLLEQQMLRQQTPAQTKANNLQHLVDGAILASAGIYIFPKARRGAKAISDEIKAYMAFRRGRTTT